MKKTIVATLVLSFLISCSKKQETPTTQNATPITLSSEDSISKFLSYSRGYEDNIIEELFKEAVEKDKALNKVTERLNESRKRKYDSLETYHKYKKNNIDYWYSLENYTNKLNDSLLRKDFKVFIKSLKKSQKERTKSIDSISRRIDSIHNVLHDMEILMKIVVTSPMMVNYQRNELPNAKKLQDFEKFSDSILTEIRPYTEFNK